MTEPSSSYFLIPASSGLCIEPKNNGIFTSEPDGKREQQWQVERGERNKIAFKNAASGDYIRANGGNKGAKVGTGKIQYFTLENGPTPNAFWIKCADFPNAYLCNSYGKYTANNLIYMWAHETYYTQTMLWYLADVDSWKEQRKAEPTLPSPSSKKRSSEGFVTRLTDLEQRQKLLEAREKESKERRESLEAREKALAEKQQQFDTKAKEAADNPAKPPTSKSTKEAENSSAKVKELQRQLQEAKDQLKEAQTSQDQLSTRVQELIDREQQIAMAYAQLQSGGAEGDIATARGVPDPQRSWEAASVGQRNQPAGLRTDRSKLGKPRIPMPQTFGYLPRLGRD